eukprot:TRINITY_DN2824_c0_g1_i3.p1 TRINITY_DN2824_c0_g1~~TRINITY_DN2824_c0_g1_i3.p1  ORF type:complete len:388 (-),score=68.72 TRINITY_DN2824_c0_g1_i3:71-1234(-)
MQAFDAFSRTENEYRVRTKSGAIISVAALVFMSFLFFTELVLFLSPEVQPNLYVDTSLGELIQINLDITFHSLPCGFISVNVMDKTGNHQLNVHDHIYLTRLSKDGRPLATAEKEEVGEDQHAPDVDLSKPDNVDIEACGNCYGAQSTEIPCCATCEDVQEAYRKKGWAFTTPQKIEQCIKEGYTKHLQEQTNESCNVRGYAKVSRVAGNLNIVPGKFLMQNSRYVLDTKMFEFDGAFNVSHTINHLSFGVDYPGMINPLDGSKKIWATEEGANMSSMYEYFVKVVPTTYQEPDGSLISTNQFSVTEYSQAIELHGARGGGVPGFFILYDLSPIMVDYRPTSKSFLHFITNLCAIIGGVFTVASLLDSFIYSGYRTLKKKMEMGKQF